MQDQTYLRTTREKERERGRDPFIVEKNLCDDCPDLRHNCMLHRFWKRLKEAEDGPPFLCPKCGRTYSHKCNLTRHLRLECGVGPRFQCANCKKRFKHRHHLRDHQRIHLYANCSYEPRN